MKSRHITSKRVSEYAGRTSESRAAFRAKAPKLPKLSEAHIKATCTAFLQSDGWRWLETDMPRARGLGVAEKGIADGLFIRYENKTQANTKCGQFYGQAKAEAMWIEWKRKDGKFSQAQENWHNHERALGALTLKAGVDFPMEPDAFTGFSRWYFASGLNRKLVPPRD